ncbi:hypothetical protein K8Q98_01800 [Candidatus Nomurabacteria bacterium]|nr:hypothetical protein [Candidatus Nomurabacteria bacterium]
MNTRAKLLGIVFVALFGVFGVANTAEAQTTRVSTCNSATFNAYVASTQSNPTTVWFEWGRNRSIGDDFWYSEVTPSRVVTKKGDIEELVTNLEPNTVYYYRAIASSKDGVHVGGTVRFRTPLCGDYVGTQSYGDPSNAPKATTLPATNITTDSAQLNASIINAQDLSSNVWFEWGTTISLGNKTSSENIGSASTASHKEKISGLIPGVTYYYRAVAENSEWRNIGNTLSFKVSGGNTTNISTTTTTVKKTTPTTTTTNTVSQNTNTDSNMLAASAIYGVAFLPTTLFGWIFLFILILILIFLIRYLLDDFEDRKNV